MQLRTLLLVTVALVLTAGHAAGQGKEAYHLRADSQEYIEEVFWRGIGNVRVAYQDIKVSCDEMELQLESGELTAIGNVVLEQGKQLKLTNLYSGCRQVRLSQVQQTRLISMHLRQMQMVKSLMRLRLNLLSKATTKYLVQLMA